MGDFAFAKMLSGSGVRCDIISKKLLPLVRRSQKRIFLLYDYVRCRPASAGLRSPRQRDEKYFLEMIEVKFFVTSSMDKGYFRVVSCEGWSISGCRIPESTRALGTMTLSGCRIPVVRLLWEQVDRVQFPASRQWYCPTVRGTVAVPKEM